MNASVSTPLEPIVDEDLARARGKQDAVLELMRKSGKDWRSAVGTMQDTPMAREAWALGEAWRKAQTYP